MAKSGLEEVEVEEAANAAKTSRSSQMARVGDCRTRCVVAMQGQSNCISRRQDWLMLATAGYLGP